VTGADRAVRVSLDVTAVPVRPVGAGHYTLELATALGRRDDLDLRLLARRDDGRRWADRVPGVEVVPVAPVARPVRLAWEQGALPRLLRRLGVGVHHGPHYTMPERSAVPMVVTVHDLSFFVEPAWHERSKVLLFRRAITTAARRAAVVVCPSHTTAAELARWCRVEAEVVVAHHGVATDRFVPDEESPGSDRDVLERLMPGLASRPFLCFVGTLEPRKAVPELVAAFDRIAGAHPEALLVLAGGDGWGTAAVEAAVARARHGDRVVRTGYVDDVAVPALLRGAVAVTYPARYEGFGLPALEALACGARLVTTSGTVMEEVAGDAARLVPPGDVRALADALDAELRGGDPDREAARERGLGLARAHTWDASAARHVHAYRLAAART
jgi:glycosyltransferase involved in cell wall biosynthesis